MSGLPPNLPPEHERLARIEAMVSELYTTFLGNLKNPGGLLGDVAQLKADVAQLKAHRSFWRQAVTTLIVSVLSSLASAAAALRLLGKSP